MDPTQFLILENKLNNIINALGAIYGRLGRFEATSLDQASVKSFDPQEIPSELQQAPGADWKAVCLNDNQPLCDFTFFFVAQQFGEIHKQITGHLYRMDLKI